MRIPLFQVDTFSSKPFSGNPAAVCPLTEWLADDLMQSIALENNLSETAFFMPKEDGYHLRWFTPVTEVALCGHATVAAAHCTLAPYWVGQLGRNLLQARQISSRGGDLLVESAGDRVRITGACVDYLEGSLHLQG